MGMAMMTNDPKPLTNYMASHDCKTFRPGDQIIMGEHRETYVACIRKPVDSLCYWVVDPSQANK